MKTSTNNLYVIKILFLVKGILTLCFSLFFVFYGVLGVVLHNLDDFQYESSEFPFHPGNFLLIIGLVGFIFALVIGILTLLVSKYIKERKNYTFIFAIAVVNALTGVLGILLAVFTLIELNKPEVKELFETK